MSIYSAFVRTRFLLLFFIVLFWLFNVHTNAYVSDIDKLPHFIPIDSQLIANRDGNLRFTLWKGSTGIIHNLTIFVNGSEQGTYPNITGNNFNSGPFIINTSINVKEGDLIDIEFENTEPEVGGARTVNTYSNIVNETNQNNNKMTQLSKPYKYADGITYCGRTKEGNFDVMVDVTDWIETNPNDLLSFLCYEDSIDWDHNDLMMRIDFVPDFVETFAETCQIPDQQNNQNSESCSNVRPPNIQWNQSDILAVANNMKGLDPAKNIKFNWADSVPNDAIECEVYYELKVWEVNDSGTKVQDIINFATSNSEYTLGDNRLDYSRNYKWQVTAHITQLNLCSEHTEFSDEYSFSSNFFPVYLQSGAAFSRPDVTDNPLNGTNPVTSTNTKCDGNVNCTNLIAGETGTWGGQVCYSGNPRFSDIQPPNGTKRAPDNPITYWFEYMDKDNFLSADCLQNEMQLHTIAMVRKDVLDSDTTPPLATVNSLLEIQSMIDNKQIEGFYFNFDVSGILQRKTDTFSNSKVDINAYRFLDVENKMRIVYEITFKADTDGIVSGEYEIFGSMMGTAIDPRGEEMNSSYLMYDIPVDWDNTQFESVPYFVEEPECQPPTNEEEVPQPTDP